MTSKVVALRDAYAEAIVTQAVEFYRQRIDREAQETKRDIQKVAEDLSRSSSGIMPMHFPEYALLHAYAKCFPDLFEDAKQKALENIPMDYRAAIFKILTFREEKPPPVVHERGTPELQYRC